MSKTHEPRWIVLAVLGVAIVGLLAASTAWGAYWTFHHSTRYLSELGCGGYIGEDGNKAICIEWYANGNPQWACCAYGDKPLVGPNDCIPNTKRSIPDY